ncbi:HRDC domain-containing protein [Oerskovia sp. M15]
MAGRRAVARARRSRANQNKVQLTGEYDRELFEQLREWRLSVAQETDKPAFTILVDTTLAAIAETRPSSVPDLAKISGIGPAKIEKYGDTLLDIVARSGA